MIFPEKISFTITNKCNLQCKMCGQWSEEGYIKTGDKNFSDELKLEDWKRLVDEIAEHKISFFLIRGGEPFLFPGIIELLEYIHDKGIFISVDTNGTMLKKYAEDIVRIGNIHLTISVDGPEEIHDYVRGVKGCFQKIKENIALIRKYEENLGKNISTSICFTISPYSYKGLGDMPDVARDLSINTVGIVPYYYIPGEIGKAYEKELRENFGCPAFSWHGFHHEDSGIDFNEFQILLQRYLNGLNGIVNDKYLPLTEDEFKTWFTDPVAAVKTSECYNVEALIDIQPNGDANFCVDFPDYTFGNVRNSSIEKLWNGEEAERFRVLRRKQQLGACYRCGAKYMGKI
jgi:MoaA/NifB/PqqE/SkfB family radical SAM enzyme